MTKNSKRFRYANQNAVIATVPNFDASFGGDTFTARRDEEGSLEATISTSSSNSTSFVVSRSGAMLELTGREARTLQRLLNKHYGELGRSQAILGAE